MGVRWGYGKKTFFLGSLHGEKLKISKELLADAGGEVDFGVKVRISTHALCPCSPAVWENIPDRAAEIVDLLRFESSGLAPCDVCSVDVLYQNFFFRSNIRASRGQNFLAGFISDL